MTQKQIDELMNVKVERFTISNEAMQQIKNILKLEEQSVEELRETRNDVVMSLAEMKSEHRNNNNYDAFDNVMIHISGITAVIDEMLFEQGGLY